MSHRVQNILGHMQTGSVSPAPTSANSDDDIVIVSTCRTAVCRAKRGQFKDSVALDLLTPVLKRVLDESGVDPKLVSDIVVGSVLAPGSLRATEARMAMLLAGYPEESAVRTVNRQCSSGLQAIADVAAAIKAGFYEVGVAAGVETMSVDTFASNTPKHIPDVVKSSSQTRGCLMPMGITSENVAARYGVTRQTQDECAVRSHRLAAAAQKAGKFDSEIVPVTCLYKDPKTGESKKITVTKDDGIRVGTTMETLGKLRAVFKKGGSTTAGNASQVSDGAAAALLMKRSTARRLGIKPKLTLRSFSAVGVEPAVMGIGPAAAIPAALAQAGLRSSDVGVFEINEAFASQATYCVNKLGLDWNKVNPNGGAIALGHPLGCTGARMTATLYPEMKRRNAQYGIVSMCIGSGMGAAAVFELEK